MADFSLRTLFVVPVGNTLPTTGSTENLTDGQFGVFKDLARTAATAGNIGTANFIQFAQGRPSLYLGSKISDKIKSTKVKKWYKVTGSGTAANEIWQFSNFVAQCDQSVSLTLRGHSSYLDTISYNGFTRSVTIETPCCACGADPCATVTNEQIVDLFMAKIAQVSVEQDTPDALNISTFWTFTKVGTGDSAKIVVESKPITAYGKFCDISLNPFEFDRVWFRGWVYVGADTSVDFLTADRCQSAATSLLTQRSSFTKGTSAEIYQMQVNYYSYQSDYKHLFTHSAYNQKFEDFVTPGTVYDTYYLVFDELDQEQAWSPSIKEDETAIIAVPQGALSSGLQTVLVAYFGAATDESGAAISTTSTSSAAPTTTTSTTTTQIP